jgi:hypothetical protein
MHRIVVVVVVASNDVVVVLITRCCSDAIAGAVFTLCRISRPQRVGLGWEKVMGGSKGEMGIAGGDVVRALAIGLGISVTLCRHG